MNKNKMDKNIIDVKLTPFKNTIHLCKFTNSIDRAHQIIDNLNLHGVDDLRVIYNTGGFYAGKIEKVINTCYISRIITSEDNPSDPIIEIYGQIDLNKLDDITLSDLNQYAFEPILSSYALNLSDAKNLSDAFGLIWKISYFELKPDLDGSELVLPLGIPKDENAYTADEVAKMFYNITSQPPCNLGLCKECAIRDNNKCPFSLDSLNNDKLSVNASDLINKKIKIYQEELSIKCWKSAIVNGWLDKKEDGNEK